MKNNGADIKVICHIGNVQQIEKQVAIIHAESVVNHLSKINISNSDKKRLIDDVI